MESSPNNVITYVNNPSWILRDTSTVSISESRDSPKPQLQRSQSIVSSNTGSVYVTIRAYARPPVLPTNSNNNTEYQQAQTPSSELTASPYTMLAVQSFSEQNDEIRMAMPYLLATPLKPITATAMNLIADLAKDQGVQDMKAHGALSDGDNAKVDMSDAGSQESQVIRAKKALAYEGEEAYRGS
ncbi:uncharacterized protein EURHEDRAFT_399748 [Aspergillus ruber CBS 135680]|uniref:Uncharacterized protein n=1 Tax=Aspergillus ruber (strain CBS 135680) TaxID=1388766 RepID=A0A017SNC9_ASPRC|nr:uncharacterized protein EURHEDRAFT_399748 [Aspergillus ruber CBS 135680]EYE98457.1 hypothetical protein EURHEDRAFT_399748 [Aspergillus ruber CBS 135680]